MGILIDCPDGGKYPSTHKQDVEATIQVLDSVGRYWDKYLQNWGYGFQYGTTKVSSICHLAEEIFSSNGFSCPPGPFKRAAALSIFTYLFLDFSFIPIQENEHMSPKDIKAWKSRIAYMAIAPCLKVLYVKDHNNKVQLNKNWIAATVHLKLDILNWIRWLEIPFTNNNENEIDIGRLKRMVQAFSLIIEQSYYITDNSLQCDVMGNNSCLQDAINDPTNHVDVWFMLPDVSSATSGR